MKKPLFVSLLPPLLFLALMLLFRSLHVEGEEEKTGKPDQATGVVLKIDFSQQDGKTPDIFLPGVVFMGRGGAAGEFNMADLPIVEEFRKDVGGLRGCNRLTLQFWKMTGKTEKEFRNYDRILDWVRQDGGTAILTLWGTTKDNIKKRKKLKTETWTHGFRYPPEDMDRWKRMVEKVIRRYSVERNGEHIIYEVWSEPNLIRYWGGTVSEYFQLYKGVAEIAEKMKKKYGANIRVAGPAASMFSTGKRAQEGKRYLRKSLNTVNIMAPFISFSAEHAIPPAAITWHRYLVSAGPYGDRVKHIKSYLKESGLDENIPCIISEWNLPTFKGDPAVVEAQNNHRGAIFILESIHNMHRRGVHRHAYFALQNFQCGNRIDREFVEDLGLTTLSGIKKAVYNSFVALGKLGNIWIRDIKIEGSSQIKAIATKKSPGGESAVLVWWFRELDHAGNEEEGKKVLVKWRHLENSGSAILRTYLIDRDHSNSYALREAFLPALTRKIAERIRERPEIKASREQSRETFNLNYDDEIYQTVERINKMPGVGLEMVEEKKIRIDKKKRYSEVITMRPYSAFLFILTPEENENSPVRQIPADL